MTIEQVLSSIRGTIELHFQECEAEGLYGKSRYLADTDHETVDDLMEEIKDVLCSQFED